MYITASQRIAFKFSEFFDRDSEWNSATWGDGNWSREIQERFVLRYDGEAFPVLNAMPSQAGTYRAYCSSELSSLFLWTRLKTEGGKSNG